MNLIYYPLIGLSLSLLVLGENPTKNVTTTKLLKNGCILTTGTSPDGDFFSTPLPHLNCTNLKKYRFDLSEAPNDTASISLSYNKLKTFNVDDLERFTSLSKLNIQRNELEQFIPSKSDLVLGKIYFLSLAHNKFKQVPREALKSFPRLKILALHGNQIRTLKDGDFSYNEELSHLGLGINPIENISPTSLTNLTLLALSLASTGIQEIPPFVGNMSSLFFLSLSNNNLVEIKKNTFYGAKNLRWLELASNKISSLDREAFAGPDNLRSLDITDNLLERLPNNIFSHMKDDQLTIELYENPLICDCDMQWFKRWIDGLLSQDVRYKCAQPKRNHGKKAYHIKISDFTCEITDTVWEESCTEISTEENLPPKPESPENNRCPSRCVCYDSNGIQYAGETKGSKKPRLPWFKSEPYPLVDCSGAQYTAIPTNIRSDVGSLNLGNNSIERLDISDLRRYVTLSKLTLKGSGLKRLIASPNTILRNMMTLNIAYNQLAALTSAHLKSFPSLKVLRIYRNQLTKIPDDLFKYNTKINRLYIGPNPIKYFNAKSLNVISKNLVSLSLRNMSLQSLPVLNLPLVNYIDLSDNNIKQLKNNSFARCPKLYRLALDNNAISDIGVSAFRNDISLRSLDLSENKIQRLPRGVFDHLNKERLAIELWVNSIVCDCSMRWFKEWIGQLESEDPMTEIRFQCSAPIRMYGKTSDTLSPEDFVCLDSDKIYTDNKALEEAVYQFEYGKRYTEGQMALAVILTSLFTCLFILLLRHCFCRRKSGYARYKTDSTAQLEMDM